TGIVLAFMGYGLWSLVAAHLVQTFIRTVLTLKLQPYPIRFRFNYQAFKALLYFSGGYSLTEVSDQLSGEGDNFIVGKFLGADALGLYGRAFQLMITPVNLFAKIISDVLFPVTSKIQDDKPRLSYLYS